MVRVNTPEYIDKILAMLRQANVTLIIIYKV